MFSKFDYKPTDYFYNTYLNSCLGKGQSIYSNFEKNSKDCLKKFIFDNGHIDGSSLKNHWFHVGKKVDVFLSHSHKDINKVQAFAGWLNLNFGLTCFIDSCVWGYCDDLLKKMMINIVKI